jgi:aryl-alcohol dehydrogenase-like predicted oxidoreductase
MRYRQLGRTGVQVSELGLGTMVFGWKTPANQACEIIDRALDGGVNLIDTSNSYGRGRSEEIIGTALIRNGRRGSVILATKVHHRTNDGDVNAFGNSRRHIIRQCEDSLRRLRTDHIDLYQIHQPQPAVPIDETLRALDDLVRVGKVLYLGSSNFAAWRVVESLWAAKEYGLNRFISEQAPYNLLDRSIEREMLPMAASFGIGIIAWSPLAEGILSGKYRRGQPLPADSRYANVDTPGCYRERLTDSIFDIIEAVGKLAREKGCTLPAFCLSWLGSRPGVACILAGPSTAQQLEDYLKSQDISVTSEDCFRVDKLVAPGAVISPYSISNPEPNLHHW